MLPLIALFLACGEHAATHAEHAEHAAAQPAEHAEHAAHAAAQPAEHAEHAAPPGGPHALGLALDGTAKWQADAHTRQVMGEIRSTLAQAQVSDAAQAAALADQVKAQLDRLIAGCTMQGPSHDQLHLFLGAFIPAVEQLRTTEDPAGQLAALQGLVAQYDQFFE